MQVKRVSRNPNAGSYPLVSQFSGEQQAVQRTKTLNSILFLPLASLVTSSSLCFSLGKTTPISFIKHCKISWWKPLATAFLILKKKSPFMIFSKKSRPQKIFTNSKLPTFWVHAPKERQKEIPQLPKPSYCKCKNGGKFSNEGKEALYPVCFVTLWGCLLEVRRLL